jgi:hypothetical protein
VTSPEPPHEQLVHPTLNYRSIGLGPLPFRSRTIGLWWHGGNFPPVAGVRTTAAPAARFGDDVSHLLVDLHGVVGRRRFGEFAHYSGNACDPFASPENDRVVGDMRSLAA